MRKASSADAFSHAPFPSAAWRGPWRNVGRSERTLSVAGGAILGLWGLYRGGLTGLLAAASGGALISRGVTGHSLIYSRVTQTPTEQALAAEQGWRSAVVFSRAITIARPRAEVFAFWRDLRNLARVMPRIERIEPRGEGGAHWVMSTPMGHGVTWDTELTEQEPDRRIAWRSVAGSMFRIAGWAEFEDAPGDRGTQVRTSLAWEPVAGRAGRVLGRVTGSEPGVLARRALDAMQQLMETGEIATNRMRRETSDVSAGSGGASIGTGADGTGIARGGQGPASRADPRPVADPRHAAEV